MHPILFKIGPFAIHTYGVFISLAFIVGIGLFLDQMRRENIKEEIFSFLFWIIISSIIGARVFYVLDNLYRYLENPQDILKIWQGGLVFYGGFIFAFAAGACFIKSHHLPFWRIANASAPSIALGISIARIGCFFNGCCYGKPWDKGLVFPSNSPAGMAFPNQPLIPTQLISSVNTLVIFFILIIFKRHRQFERQSFLWLLIFYSIHRFIIEFFRSGFPAFLNLTFSQLVSIILGASAVILMRSSKTEG